MSLPAPTPEWLSALSAIAGAAGREVLDVYGGAFTSRTKEDGSPVTEADLRADAAIRRGLAAAFPGVFVLSEESVSAPAGPAPRFFLVDPLDGTKEFLQRNGEFTVNIALVEGGEPVAGVVLAPALGLLWGAARGHGAWRSAWAPGAAPGSAGATPLRVAPAAEGPLRVLVSRSHRDARVDGWLRRLHRPCRTVAAGSSLKFCRIAEGAADLYPRFGPTHPWDTAAGQCVLECAGGAVVDAGGHPLRYDARSTDLNPDFLAVAEPQWRHLLAV